MLIGMVSRLVSQKGFDLLERIMEPLLQRDVQFVLLGTGDPHYEGFFREMAGRFRERARVQIGFNDALAHRIEAGADVFLMPSQYEPSGLNQLYSLKYGTIPIVRATGGLKDSVQDFNYQGARGGNGFVFEAVHAGALLAHDRPRAGGVSKEAALVEADEECHGVRLLVGPVGGGVRESVSQAALAVTAGKTDGRQNTVGFPRERHGRNATRHKHQDKPLSSLWGSQFWPAAAFQAALALDHSNWSAVAAKDKRKNNFAGETVARALLRAASRFFSTLLRPGTPGVDTSVDSARKSACATWASSQM